MKAVRPAAQHRRIAALEAQGAGVRGDVGPALVNHADDAERRRDAFDPQSVGPLEMRQNAPDRVGQRGDLLDPARHRLDPAFVERQPVDESRRQPPGVGGGQIAGVGGEDFVEALAQRSRGGDQRVCLRRRRRIGEGSRGLARLAADRAHRRPDIRFGLDKTDRRLHKSHPVGAGLVVGWSARRDLSHERRQYKHHGG
jgi:hypothetical protein